MDLLCEISEDLSKYDMEGEEIEKLPGGNMYQYVEVSRRSLALYHYH